MAGPADAKTKIDKAVLEKEAGNTAFKANEITKALRSYYNVILLLKGVHPTAFNGYQPKTCSPPAPSHVGPKISEVTEEEEKLSLDNQAKEAGDGEEDEEEEEDDEDEEEDETYSPENVKKLMAQCYVNMATCHSKNNAWEKCKRNAVEALKLDENNPKAKFRQAQATVRLGEITKGRQLLLDLQKTNDDASIRNELKILQQAEKAREDKSKNSMRGFINKANPTVPKFEEIVHEKPSAKIEEVAAPPETPVKKASQGSASGDKKDAKKVELPPTPPKTE